MLQDVSKVSTVQSTFDLKTANLIAFAFRRVEFTKIV